MNAPTMNKMQLCSAGATGPSAIECIASRSPASRRGATSSAGALRAAVGVLLAAAVAVGAATWLVINRDAPLQVVELPRVVIHAQKLPPGACPVPVEPAGAACPVPLQAGPGDAVIEPSLARSIQP